MALPLSANLIVCSEVLVEEKTTLLSAIRMMSSITILRHESHVHIWSIVFVSSIPGDHDRHRMLVTMTGPDSVIVASAEASEFEYGYKVDPTGNGGFSLRTEFNVEVSRIPASGTYWMNAHVDGHLVARTPVTLRR